MFTRHRCRAALRRAVSTILMTAVLGCLVPAAAIAAPPDPCHALSATSFAVEHA
jgi:hypothetical protein